MANARARRLAAIMFTDIVGFSAMMQEDEDLTLQRVDLHRKTLEALTAKHGGEVIQYYGDGSLSIYSSAVEALQCALEMQLVFRKSPGLPLRIGLHIGDIAFKGKDIFGDGINVASRIETLGVAGSVLFSERVYDDIKNHPEFQFQLVGAFEFKNINQPLKVFALTNDHLPLPTSEDLKKGKLKKKGPHQGKKHSLRWTLPLIVVTALLLLFFQPFDRLKSILGELRTTPAPMIIVEPFQLLHPGIDTALADALVQELRNSLANTEALLVVRPTTSRQLAQLGLGMVRNRIEADYLIEGSINTLGQQWMIQASLTDLRKGETQGLASRKIAPDSVLLLGPELTLRVAEKLNIPLSPELRSKIQLSPSDSLKALELYYKSDIYLRQYMRPDTAIEMISQAIAIDSNFAKAYALRAYFLLESATWTGVNQAESVLARAASDIEKAFYLNPNLPEAFYSRAFANMMFNWDFEAAEKDYVKANALVPPNKRKDTNYGWYLNFVKGAYEKALPLHEREYRLDPENLVVGMEYAVSLYFSGRKKQAFEVHRKMMEHEGESMAKYWVAVYYFGEGNYERALAYARKGRDCDDPRQAPWDVYMEGYIAAKTGNREKAMSVVQQIDRYELDGIPARWEYSYARAAIYALLGEKDNAIQELEKALSKRETNLVTIRGMTPLFFYKIADEPDFLEIQRKIGVLK